MKIFPTVERTEDLDAWNKHRLAHLSYEVKSRHTVEATDERELERLSPGMLIVEMVEAGEGE